MTVQLAGEQLLGEGDRLVLVGAVQPGQPPHRLGAFEDEGREPLVVAIGVHAPQAVLAFLEEERERPERKRRAQPHEAVRAPVDLRLEVLGVARPEERVHAVGGQHEIGPGPGRGIVDLCRELQADAELGGAGLQDVEQPLARQPGEAVAGRRQHLILIVDLDVVPVREGAGDGGVGLGVGLLEILERRVGEHDAEAERVVRSVALENGDVVPGIGLLHEDREVEAGRSAADRDDLHTSIVPEGTGDRFRLQAADTRHRRDHAQGRRRRSAASQPAMSNASSTASSRYTREMAPFVE